MVTVAAILVPLVTTSYDVDPLRSKSSAMPAVTVYGASGSFGTLGSVLPTGQTLMKVAIPNWGFAAGQAAYFSAVSAGGTVVIANEPQTDNQSDPTADTMELSTFDPSANRFNNVIIPTSTGSTSALIPGSMTGGADIAGVTAIPGSSKLAFVSLDPYNGWNPQTVGQYPSLGYLSNHSGRLSYDAPDSMTAAALENSSPQLNACPVQIELNNCDGLSDVTALANGDIAATQYFGTSSSSSGGVIVLSSSGRVLAHHLFPSVNLLGTTLATRPRELVADPKSTANDLRFAVISDTTSSDGAEGPYLLQELSFSPATATIAPMSSLLQPNGAASQPEKGFEDATYDAHGNLWAATAVANTLTGGDTGLYLASASGQRSLQTRCGARANQSFVQVCPFDIDDSATASEGLVYGMSSDSATGDILSTTISGDLQLLVPEGSPITSIKTPRPIDLGLSALVNRNNVRVLPRQGAIDVKTHTLWFAIEQMETPATCASSCPAQSLSQWLDKVNLNIVESGTGFVAEKHGRSLRS